MAGVPAHVESRTASVRSHRAWWAVGLAALVAVAVAIAIVMWSSRGGGPSPGPLDAAESSSLGIGRVAGRPFAYGLPVVLNRGSEEVVLDRIEILDAPAGLRVLETRIGGVNRDSLAVASTLRWPSRQLTDLHPVSGYRVPPVSAAAGDRGVELVFVLAADSPGEYAFKRLAIDYHVGDSAHRDTLSYGMRVCVTAPGEPVVRGCPPPTDL